MDITTILGLILGVGFLGGAFVMEGGHITSLFQITAAMIVFGGTFAALMVSTPMEQLKQIPKILKIAFTHKSRDPLEVIDELVILATIARREGILALEEKIDTYDDEFFKNGVRLVVDGVDPELVRSIMETELSFIEERHNKGAQIFEQMGGFAPTMGIIGTVMGLVHVLSNLEDAAKLGPAIALAFIATLYGVASANLAWLPIANKLKVRSKQEVLIRELMIEGILSIQAGENPNILAQKLKVFLAPTSRTKNEAAEREVGGTNVETA
ncbi:flagellar motor protein [Effusibacillus lacus]|uniref:Motility protein A n=1 Tax=Effusibacillus lacus TaxID=1348429 RepID=A0A292YE00_9BACL|nr:flagellar motor protein [Effusibacillus lacus]TCS74181.1 chemotaxis protein MotA [Effusibacillus lacus]GAX90822.1 motility protein A [Effusibacillus lacus]